MVLRIFKDRICKLSPEMCRLEFKIKVIALPVATLVMTLYLLYCYTLQDYLVCFGEAAVGVTVIWFVNRFIILVIKKKCSDSQYRKRITLQLFLTLLVSVCLLIILFVTHKYLFGYIKIQGVEFTYLKNLVVTVILFTFLVNGSYEIIFLFERLSQEQAETEKYKKAVLESSLENLRSQINPHFLFNTFNALSELIEVNPKRASNIVIELSDVYRYVLQTRDKNWETLENEIKVTGSFIEIVKIRYEENVKISMEIDPSIYQWHLPPMSIQMLIENAIKHNEISKEKPLTIEINSTGESILVKNNYQPKVIAEISNGVGLQNIQSRYTFLSNKKVRVMNEKNIFRVELPLLRII
jgi:two-component system LytT family sensor kinase